MYEELKYLARSNCIIRTGKKNNILKLLINRNEGLLNLSFKEKPPSHIRRHLRFIGFSWSRKNRYWRSYLNNIQEKRVQKFYENLIKNK